MTVSEYIVEFLKNKGIDAAFAVIGSTAMWLFNALGKEEGIRTICTNHEQAAAMAADGWACITGKPGVVFLTNGPGVTNALSGVAQAWTDSVPMIVVSGEAKTTALEHEIETDMRQYGPQSVRTDITVSPFVKEYYLVSKPQDIRKIIEQAYSVALSGRPGPVWISVPVDVQNAKVPDNMVGAENSAQSFTVEKGIYVSIKNEILSAKRPLIIAGQGIRMSGAEQQLKTFVEKYNLPLVTSRMGNDVIETSHPMFIGRPGNWGTRAAHFAIQTADLLLVLGSRLSLNTTGHTPSDFARNAKKIIVDIDPVEFKKPGIEFDTCVCQDVAEFLKEIENVDATDPMLAQRKKWCNLCLDWKRKYPVVTEEYRGKMPMSTYHFMDRLSSLSAENDIILSDTGSCCNIVSQVWDVKKGQRLRVSGGLSCMGYWATSIGVARANEGQESNVVCVVGDGSLQMNLQELGTVVHYGLPIKLIVINNNGYQIIRISQNAYQNGQLFAVSPETGVGIADTEKIAQAYGIAYRKVDSPEQVDDAIKWALASDSAVILEAVVDEDQIMLPRLTSKVQADGTLKSAKFEDLAPFLSEEELAREIRRAEYVSTESV